MRCQLCNAFMAVLVQDYFYTTYICADCEHEETFDYR
jgi:hypothetical protein